MDLKRKLFLGILIVALICTVFACAHALTVTLPVTYGSVNIHSTVLNDEQWLFLPAFANSEKLPLEWLPSEAENVRLAETAEGEKLYVMQSENLRTVFLFSDDPISHGREYIENCSNHQNRTTGRMAIVDPSGRVNYTDRLRQLRGRGNGTWLMAKKAYQFKLENRFDLLQTSKASEAARTWVLLAESSSMNFLHNKLAYDMGLELGLENAPHSEYVDLYYDGEYRGTYLLASMSRTMINSLKAGTSKMVRPCWRS